MKKSTNNRRLPLIYTLFPRLAGTMPQWLKHSARAADLGFVWIHLNPVHLTGWSNSLYAIKDFYQIDPDFVPQGCTDPMKELKRTIAAMHEQGLLVMMDLVVNHTASDSPLVTEHKRWFNWDKSGKIVHPFAVDPDSPDNITIWGDLAEVNNAKSRDKKNLWAYWKQLIEYYLDLGFDGFRCDAAYKVPAALWKELIKVGRNHTPDVVFTAETLGCSESEVQALASAGFDFLFNSSKWWNYDKPWCLEQHEAFGKIGPSIAFPETHDTARVMEEAGGRVQVQKQRYAFAAAFSAGLLMPIGYEFCARRQLHVVETVPDDWEEVVDIRDFIKQVNAFMRSTPIMHVEGHWKVLTDLDSPTTLLRKRATGCAPLVVVINKDWHNPQQVALPELKPRFKKQAIASHICRPGAPKKPVKEGNTLHLEPAEVVYVTGD